MRIAVLALVFCPWHRIPDGGLLRHGRASEYTGPEDDDALIALMLRTSGGASAAFGQRATVAQLWNTDPMVLPRTYSAFDGGTGFDHSSDDAALMSHLAF